MSIMDFQELFKEALERADYAKEKFGPHRSAEYTCCRIAEESGELIQAATSSSRGRNVDRAPKMREEALDTIAMIIRLFREWPNGME